MNPTEKPLALTLGGQRYQMFFDLNTYSKFEELAGKPFMRFLADLDKAASLIVKQQSDENNRNNASTSGVPVMDFLGSLSVRDIQAFCCAAIHTYDPHTGEPQWPLTVGKLGRLITTENLVPLINTILKGNATNAIQREDLRETADRPTVAAGEQNPAAPAGGPAFGPSDESILGSLTPRSDDSPSGDSSS